MRQALGRTDASEVALLIEGEDGDGVVTAGRAAVGRAVPVLLRPGLALLPGGDAGWRDVIVQYFDQQDGVSHFRVWVANQLVDEWAAADRLPARKVDSSSSSRRVIRSLALRKGDEIRIEGVPDGRETAALDYIEIVPAEN